MDYSNYYLDLKEVSKLNLEEEKNKIHDYYRDLLSKDYDKEISNSFFNTLYEGGYLKEIRKEKIDKILS